MGSFDAAYEGTPPWEIGKPQPAFVALAEAGVVRGSVLDVGCGTGENALLFAARGHEVVGVDSAPRAIARAQAKARERGLAAEFLVADALELGKLRRTFDAILDCGLFHVFDDAGRVRFVASLGEAAHAGTEYHMLCFSDREPPGWGPRRVTEAEIREAFREGWEVLEVAPDRFDTLVAGRVQAWRVRARRTVSPESRRKGRRGKSAQP